MGLSCQGPATMRACAACGGTGQACCPDANGGNGTCNMGFNCAGAGVGMCAACGAMGQACCGAGPIAMRTCTTGLTCQLPDAGGGGATCR